MLAGCEMTGPQSIMNPAGPVAAAQKDLLMWSYWLSWIVIVGTFGVLGYVLVRFRRRRDDPDAIPAQFHGSAPLEIGLTILPTIIVILVAVPTVRTIFETEQRVSASGDDVIVNVTGYQWWWRFEYPELGVVTANEAHIPVGRRVVFNLDSADVLHSFWVPRLAGKRDLIPNQNNQVWMIADEPGNYYGQCAELCLGAHAYMKFRVIAESDEAFDGWVSTFTELGPQTVQLDPDIERGRQLFAQKGCTNCHTIDGYRADVRVGTPDFPNLTNFGLRTTLAAGVVDNTQENLERWLRDPQEIKPGNYMPRLWRTSDENADEEIAAVARYLLSLGLPETATAQASAGGIHGDR
jgi:cytochrome c oxidase subunit 2